MAIIPGEASFLRFLDYFMSRRRILRRYFRIGWTEARTLKPDVLLGLRARAEHGFSSVYLERAEDEEIYRNLVECKNLLIIGKPFSGKTRMLIHALHSLPDDYDVIVLREGIKVDPGEFFVPRNKRPQNKCIAILDDINRYAFQSGFEHLVRALVDKGIPIAATCREDEHKQLYAMVEKDISLLFGKPVAVDASKEDVIEMAEAARIEVPSWFNGTIGSLFLPIQEMQELFHKCTLEERAVLRGLRSLFIAGVASVKEGVQSADLKAVVRHQTELSKREIEWTELLQRLRKRGFLELAGSTIKSEEAYLDNVVEPVVTPELAISQLIRVFESKPDHLLRIGGRALAFAHVGLRRLEFARLAIEAYREALKVRTFGRFPMDYAITQNNLGNAYRSLAEVKDKEENCTKAIKACREALKVRTFDRFPMDYAITQNNLGKAYGTLAEVKDKEENCTKAIEAFREALKVRTFDRFPMDYAITQNNLGGAYGILAVVKDKEENCTKAIEACREALKVRTFDRFPMDYAITQNNLGNAYGTLAEAKDKEENCTKAIEAYREALKVRTFDRFPMDYAITQNNLGNAYGILAEAKDKEENCTKAIEAYREALKVRTFGRFPMDYAITQNNLGNAYRSLAEVKDKEENCTKAIEACREALKVRTFDRFPMDYAITQNNLGNAYGILAEVKDKEENCTKAIEAYREALRVFKGDALLQLREAVVTNISALQKLCESK